MHNSLKINQYYWLVLLSLSLVMISCSGHWEKQANSYIDLYEITGRQCVGAKVLLQECNSTKFIELVHGQFFGVKNSEVAVIFWRGNKGEELLYQARKIELKKLSNITSGEIVLLNTETEKEIIKLVDGKIAEYDLVVSKSKTTKQKTHYTLKSVKRGLLPEYRMNYPGNH